MQRERYVDIENKTKKGRLRIIGGILLWGLMIGVSMILASQSMILAGEVTIQVKEAQIRRRIDG